MIDRMMTLACLAVAMVAALVGDAVAQTCVAPPPDLVSWWPGNGNANDIKDGNPGTLTNGATFAAGRVSQAFSLDGVDDYVDVGNQANLNFGTGDFTLELWISTLQSPTSDVPMILNKQTTTGAFRVGYEVFLQSAAFGTSGAVAFVIRDGSGSGAGLESTTVVNDGTFHHVAAKKTSSALELFVDGVSQGTVSHSLGSTSNSESFRLGDLSDRTTGNNKFAGLLDEVSVYNRALTASEIQAVYAAGSAGKCSCPFQSDGDPCTDGIFCNGPDMCSGGACTIHAGDPCIGGPECAHTCNEAGGNCFDPVTTGCTSDGNVCTDDHCNGSGACVHTDNTGPCASDGNPCTDDVCASGSCTHPNNTASCDDGNACTINDTCSGGTCSGTVQPEACLDHFQCYKSAVAKAPVGQPPYPRFTPHPGVTVVDQFSGPAPDQREMDLKATKTICNPTDKNGEDVTAPGHPQHFESYVAKITKLVPPQPKPTPQVKTIQNQLGTLKLKVTMPDRVMVPSAKVLGTSPPSPLTPPTIDHFKCYHASVAKAPKGQPPYPTWTLQTVTLTDEFNGPLQYDLVKPTRLCNPADKNSEDPTAPTHIAHLVCYKAKLTKLPTPQPKFVKTGVSTTNQFGSEVINATALDELCVPSLRLD
jgi:concanavalin A-like lectin/glucanase superfamily protein